jgi:hypothetical protein
MSFHAGRPDVEGFSGGGVLQNRVDGGFARTGVVVVASWW